MIMVAISVVLVMRLFPATATGRVLHRYLVELPLLRIGQVGRHQLIFAILVVAMLLCASEIIVLAGSFDLAIVYAWDVSLYIDSLVAVSTLAATTRIKPLVLATWSRLRPGRPVRRAAARRKRSVTRGAPAMKGDDDGESGVCYALAA